MARESVIGNFNCTFGKENLPMLTYFNEVIYPAFNNGLRDEENFRRIGEDKYFFQDIKILKEDNRYILRGLLTRKTKLVVESEYKNGGMQFERKLYDSAPVSIFSMYLDNHKFVYTTNQKGSPDIRSFSATVKWYIKEVIKEINRDRMKGDKIPYPILNVINIPEKGTIIEKMNYVEKIKKLNFKMVNPNGDIATDGIFEELAGMLKSTEGNSLNVVNNSPANKENTIELINQSVGYADFKVEVKYKDGSNGRLDNLSMTKKFSIDVPKETSIENIGNIAFEAAKNNKILVKVSEENQEIYAKYLKDILKNYIDM